MAPRQGWYKLKNPDKYINSSTSITKGKGIRYMSSWEERFFLFCDFNSSILRWSSEPFPIQYFNEADGKNHRYFVDLYMEYIDKNEVLKKCLVEIKPKKETLPPIPPKRKTTKSLLGYEKAIKTYVTNQCKWNAARNFCKMNNLDFIIITEEELF